MILFRLHFLLLCFISLLTQAHAERPNIIFIMADDLGYSDIGCYGGEIKTPNLDKLAAGGLRFRQFYNASKCSESRASLMTGYSHHVSRNLKKREYPTIAELMREAGYQTLMVGKWHLADTPRQRGFDRYFGFLNGAVNFWTGQPTRGEPVPRWLLDDNRFIVPKNNFYTTDAFTDYAIEFINQAVDDDKPFFLYLAHNAPHYPLHAWPEDIEKYRGKYAGGWDLLRAERLERMKTKGVIPRSTKMSERDPNVPAWESLTPKQKKEYDLLMAVYAAMVDRLDQNIGRLINHLTARGIEKNTLVMFCSDNGGCPYQNEEKPNSTPGGPESHRTYNTPWANASNTPFRLYKRFSHEGGVSTPMIMYWPQGIKQTGGFTDQQAHLVDLLPTCVQLAGGSVPAGVDGENLGPIFDGVVFDRKRPLIWEYTRHRAVREGDFKLVAESGEPWSLYNIAEDRIESNDLSGSMAKKVSVMSHKYDTWSKKVGAPSSKKSELAKPMAMKNYNKILGGK